jgi:hypothetical protein
MVFEPIVGLYAGHLVSETSKSIVNKIWDLLGEARHNKLDINIELDIESKVTLIESIIRDINEEIKIHSLIPTKSLELALLQMKDIIDRIHLNFVEIRVGIQYYESLWFKNFRTPAYLEHIELLKKNNIILDARLDNLVKIIMLFKHTIKKDTNTNTTNINDSI